MSNDDEILRRIGSLSPEKRALLEQALTARGIQLAGRRARIPEQSNGPETADLFGGSSTVAEDLPTLILAPNGSASLPAWLARNRERVEAMLSQTGGLLFRGFGVEGAVDFEACIEAGAGTSVDYAGIYQGVAVRKHVHGKIHTSTEFSPGAAIELHSECSFAHCWPLRIFFFCAQAANQGGQTPIADTRGVLRRLDPEVRARFENKGVMYLRNYGIGSAPSWQAIFQTGNRGDVERICQSIGVHAEWIGETRLRTRSLRPAVVRHPLSGEPVWFNHVNSAHVRSNDPALSEALLSEFEPEDLPRNCYYGDGTEIDVPTLEAIRKAYLRETKQFEWQAGDVLMLDNILVAHGRQPYAGQRQVLVGMAVNVRRRSPESMAMDVELEPWR